MITAAGIALSSAATGCRSGEIARSDELHFLVNNGEKLSVYCLSSLWKITKKVTAFLAKKDPSNTSVRPSLFELFLICLKIGLSSFGGGLSGWFYKEFVLARAWISEDSFAANSAISQMLPGANVINLAVCLGDQLRGILGAVVCLFGLLVGPFFVVIGLYVSFQSLSYLDGVQATSSGIAFAALGLIVVMCIHSVKRTIQHPLSMALVILTATTVGILQWPLLLVVLVVAPASVALAWRRI
jgi:chromate transporter